MLNPEKMTAEQFANLSEEQLEEIAKSMSRDRAAASLLAMIFGKAYRERKMEPDALADILSAGLDFYRIACISGFIETLTTQKSSQPFHLLEDQSQDKLESLQRATMHSLIITEDELKKRSDKLFLLAEVLLGIQVTKTEKGILVETEERQNEPA